MRTADWIAYSTPDLTRDVRCMPVTMLVVKVTTPFQKIVKVSIGTCHEYSHFLCERVGPDMDIALTIHAELVEHR